MDANAATTTAATGSPQRIDVTTVSDREAALHVTLPDGTVDVHRFDDLAPGRSTTVHIDVDGTTHQVDIATLPTLPGELLCRFATVNDVHFGELSAGQIDDLPEGPIRRSEPGSDPYPEVMNRAAVAEMLAIDPAAVIVKGDLSVDGTDDEWAAFEACYREPLGDRLHVVRGNHDAYRHQHAYAGDQRIDLPGLTVALLDTAIPGATTGAFRPEQSEWLDDVARNASNPIMVMGHHQQWIPTSSESTAARSPDYFGLHPDGSDLLDELCVRHHNVLAYSAGHTHRHRRRGMRRSGALSIEVGCTKDFPGTWAEHRVYESGVLHVVHRISEPAALRWSESCRGLYADFGVDYETYALGALDDRCFVIALR
jgi:3',5'-cyclic-AMP phosphodiesterase